jgi:hypothetical protein
MNNILTSLEWNDLCINMIGLTGLYVCLELLSGWGLVMECFVMYVAGKRVRRAGWFHWHAVPWLADSVDGTWIPSGSFLCFFYMVVLDLVCHLLLHIRVYCLICVLRMLKPGYWFWCSVCVLYVLLLSACLTALYRLYCMYCILFHIYMQ